MKALNIKRGQQAGFTLIELIVVIVILGVLAAMVMTKYDGSLKTAAQDNADSYSTKSAATATAAEVIAPAASVGKGTY
jgi:prepilin-type N-terminal cleavage/methylation domain-containing protein